MHCNIKAQSIIEKGNWGTSGYRMQLSMWKHLGFSGFVLYPNALKVRSVFKSQILNNSILKYNSIWISLPNVLTQFKTLSHLDFSFHPPPCPQNPYHVPLPHSSPKSLLSGVASAPFRPPYLCTSCFSLRMPRALLYLEAPHASFGTQVPSLCLYEISLAPQAVCGSLQRVHLTLCTKPPS